MSAPSTGSPAAPSAASAAREPAGTPASASSAGAYATVGHAFGVVGRGNSWNNVDPFEPGPGAPVWEAWRDAANDWDVADLEGMRVQAMPSPRDPGGLPDGWKVVGGEFLGHHNRTFHLVRAHATGDFPGCWAIVAHLSDMVYTVLERDVPHLNDLLVPGAAAVARASSMNADGRHAYEQWLLHTVADLYDTTDPAQAAERTLLLLSGRARVEPLP